MTWGPDAKPWNRRAFDDGNNEPEYPQVIEVVSAAVTAGGGEEHRNLLPRLRAAAAAAVDPTYVAEVDRIGGLLAARSGEVEGAKTLLMQAHAGFCSQEEWELAAWSLSKTAEITYGQEDRLQAATLWHEAAEIAAREPDPAYEDASDYLACAAQCEVEMGDPPAAIETYRLAIDLALEGGHDDNAAVLCHDLGHVLEQIGEVDDAIEAWVLATELDREGTAGAASRAWTRLSETYRDHGLTEQAQHAASQASLTANDSQTAREARWQSFALNAEYDPGSADLNQLRHLRDDGVAAQDQKLVAACDVLEAGLAHRQGRHREAAILWDRAAVILTDENEFLILASLHADRATRLAAVRDAVGARHHLEEARSLFLRVGRLQDADECDRNLQALHAEDDPDSLRARYVASTHHKTRNQAHQALGLAGVEFGFQRFEATIAMATPALEFFTAHSLQESELETRLLLASAQDARGRRDLAEEHLQVLLHDTEGGLYPAIRGQAFSIVGTGAMRRGDLAAAAAAYREAAALQNAAGGLGLTPLVRLNLAAITALSDPEEALRHASLASAEFSGMGMVGSSARADLAASFALGQLGAWQNAFDTATPAMLVVEVLRTALASPGDRRQWREIWTWAQDQILNIAANLDQPRATAELLERLRANATATVTRLGQPSSAADVLGTFDNRPTDLGADQQPVATLDAGWSAGNALIADQHQIAVGLPPLVGMPWGIALGPYEAIATQRLADLSDRHRADRPTVRWADQIAFP